MRTSKSFGLSRQSRLARISGPIIALATIISMILAPAPVARAATSLTVTPITWNVIGLDSNNVNVGPNQFPIGARVCNTSTAGETLINVTASFVWDSSNPYINLRPGTSATLSVASSAADVAGQLHGFLFRGGGHADVLPRMTRRETITLLFQRMAGCSGSTPTPRALYVEHLISQNRNSVTKVLYGTSLNTPDPRPRSRRAAQ